MSGAVRGPAGVAALPPVWLNTVHLPMEELPSGSSFARVHWSTFPPIFFSPGLGKPPAGRFDSASGAFGVLYASSTFEGAFAETVLRNPGRRLIGIKEIADRSLSVIGLTRAVRLVQMRGAGLQTLGLDNAITTGPYEPCGIWADALFAHPDLPDGIAYGSRHDPDQACVALFARPDLNLDIASDPVPLTSMLANVGVALRRYGKSLTIL